jgi:hypothetical protein
MSLAIAAAVVTIIPNAAIAAPCANVIPFGVAKRLQPTGTEVGQVLPSRVARFVREPVAAGTPIPSNEDFNITYRAGKDSVFMGLSRAGSAADTKSAVRTAREDVLSDKSINRRGEIYCTESEPFFYKIPDFIAWSRGPYFLYAHASSPAVLDEFMRAFPY